MTIKKIAFVAPWYGADIPGGAEAEVRRTAENLHRRGWPVEVLTTCIRDFHSDWAKNAHAEGLTAVNGVPVRRFKVQRRNRERFDAVNFKLLNRRLITPAEEQVYLSEMINPPGLYRFIEQHRAEYFFFFIPYLFSTTYWGARLVPERSCIIACLHDEPYARLPAFRELFGQVRAMLFHSPAENRLAARLYDLERTETLLVGEGVDTELRGDGAAFRARYGLEGTPFILYAGRRSPEKNVPLLVDYFARYKQAHPGPLKLVLIGSGSVALPAETADSFLDLGFVSLQDKYDAYAAADVLCQPSLNESFSLVIMEAWLSGTPVLVHDGCEVTREHCLTSNGGLFFGDYPEFEATVDFLLADPLRARRMGANGRQYVLENFAWDRIMERYETALRRWGVSDGH